MSASETLRRARARVEAARTAALERFESTQERWPVVGALLVRIMNVGLMDAATRLAAQPFLTTIPLMFALGAFGPDSLRKQMLSSLRTTFGLTGDSAQQVKDVVQASNGAQNLQQTVGVIGLVMALLSATSCSRVLARVCADAWALPKARSRPAAWRWLVWIICLVGFVLLQGVLRSGFGAGLWLGVPLTFLASVVLWWWTQHLLLVRRLAWLPLLPGAVLCAVATSALSLTARVYMPNALNRTLHDYGSLGLVLTLLSWLIVLSAAIVFGITLGAVLAQHPPLQAKLKAPLPRETTLLKESGQPDEPGG
ncbi:YhjD/YihY/BrkB family envelope integrity protein [Streptacidiphilus neutrinimicus]|uniref:YhjD/YihY/BrkB family envelope integrity protein n=1 Tax=Streptacidiphilus neutrinimicus TaxID=105420 RepID=UPI000A6D94E4|nr:YhjD/YihY/BrkB family envelope integrity protein [Streptacidiphilus neutrinimicus]